MGMNLKQALREAILAKPTSKWVLVDGHPCATSDFFFGDGDNRPVALIDPYRPGWIFLDKEDVRRREARLSGPDDRPGDEHAFELQIFHKMLAKGVKVRRQVRCSTGIIDLLIERDPPWIVEIKAIGDFFSVARAAAQLWLYRRDYPKARLFVAVPPPISPDAGPFLEQLGIAIFDNPELRSAAGVLVDEPAHYGFRSGSPRRNGARNLRHKER